MSCPGQFERRARGRLPRRALLALALVLGARGAAAVDASAPAAGRGAETVTEELIRLLAARMALAPEDAERLIKRLQTEKAQAAAPAAPAASDAAASAGGAGRLRVIYVPESEKQQMRAQIKDEVLATAREENWAQPHALPDWLGRLQFDGDLRVRQEFDFLDSSNSPQFINFQAVNSGAPLNTNPPAGQPLSFPVLNSTEDRQQTKVRARLGLLANVSDQLSAGLRFSTGSSTNPVSGNQSLGNDFNKFSVSLDRAWLNYRFDTTSGTQFWGGRIPNPWLATELVWDDDISFDGAAAQHALTWSPDLVQHTTLGLFSLQNTEFDFPGSSLAKESSRDAWLLGLQSGVEWRYSEDVALEGALAWYDFIDYEGDLSSSCYAPNTAVACDTDHTRPQFIQKGNTLFALRDLVVLTPSDPTFQYFGLASEFSILDLSTRLDWSLAGGMHLVFDADLAWNMGFDDHDIEQNVPVNNFRACPAEDPLCSPTWQGGDLAWIVPGLWGVPRIAEAGQWNAILGYRRVESDAVVDAFTDSDFHLGGTNAKGYYLAGNYGIAPNAWLGARWISTTEVSGAPWAVDVLMLDLNARF